MYKIQIASLYIPFSLKIKKNHQNRCIIVKAVSNLVPKTMF